jgi:hypothetical protein
MAPNEKSQPTIALAPPPISERLALALKDETLRRSFSIRLRIAGGVRSQQYSFEFVATGEGRAECRFACAASGRAGDSTEAGTAKARPTLSPQEFLSLLRKVEAVARQPRAQPRFPPDTLVGILEISDGREVHRVYFAADPDQAETLGLTPPAELLAAVNAIYALGAKLTGQRSVKP